MYAYGARFYDPSIGRFTGVDPLTDQMPSWSPFTYTFNNPINFTDPDGRMPQQVQPGDPPNIGVYLIQQARAGIFNIAHSIKRNSQIVFGGADPSSIPYRRYGVVEDTSSPGGMSVGYVELAQEPSTWRRMLNTVTDGLDASAVLPQGGGGVSTLASKTGGPGLSAIIKGFSQGDLLSSGNLLDKADKLGELTVAGRALQKHGSRPGSNFPVATGNAASKNSQGFSILGDILGNSKSTTTTGNRFDGFDVMSPNGQGARFDDKGSFRGFIEGN